MRILDLLLIIFCGFFVLTVAKAGFTVYLKSKKVYLLQNELVALATQKESLEKEYAYRQGRDYVELIAKRDLLMTYPNQNSSEIRTRTTLTDTTPLQKPKEEELVVAPPTPVYKLWLKVFGIP